MDESSNNSVFLRGVPAAAPAFSHESRTERFFLFPLEVARLSGNVDRINVLFRESMLSELRPSRAGLLEVRGELRSYNNRSGSGSRLVITVFAQTIETPSVAEWENRVDLCGTLCRAPNYRSTPMGREIADLLLAVNRRYGRSDYLPCIVWGRNARRASHWDVGTTVRLRGRVQSREYIKMLDGQAYRKTAYEVSVAEADEI